MCLNWKYYIYSAVFFKITNAGNLFWQDTFQLSASCSGTQGIKCSPNKWMGPAWRDHCIAGAFQDTNWHITEWCFVIVLCHPFTSRARVPLGAVSWTVCFITDNRRGNEAKSTKTFRHSSTTGWWAHWFQPSSCCCMSSCSNMCDRDIGVRPHYSQRSSKVIHTCRGLYILEMCNFEMFFCVGFFLIFVGYP